MKKLIALFLISALCVSMLSACDLPWEEKDISELLSSSEPEEPDLKVGAISYGSNADTYTLVQIEGMDAAADALAEQGVNIDITYRMEAQDAAAAKADAEELIAEGCTLIITDSYEHQGELADVVAANPEVSFVSISGDMAAASGYTNWYNAYTRAYEARYVSGVAAGMKLKELADAEKLPETAYNEDGKIKVGYVGAYESAEVTSGYTAFFLGIESVIGQDKAAMTVKYTDAWYDESAESAAAEYLMEEGCVIIGQHCDTEGVAEALEEAYEADDTRLCYCVGYNITMADIAPNVALVSAINNWDVYYNTLFAAAAAGTEIPRDWTGGLAEDAVGVSELGSVCTDGTQEAVDAAISKITSGELRVFDTSKFKVGGEAISSYMADVVPDSEGAGDTEAISDGYFHESEYRSAPYFNIKIDGITEIPAAGSTEDSTEGAGDAAADSNA